MPSVSLLPSRIKTKKAGGGFVVGACVVWRDVSLFSLLQNQTCKSNSDKQSNVSE